MNQRRRLIPTIAVALLAVAPPCLGDEAEDVFQSLYGEELRQVAATGSVLDDVALAGRLLEAAKSAKKQPALLAVLCNKAYELGIKHPSGLDTAVEAMQLLYETSPDHQSDSRTKLVDLWQKVYLASRGTAKIEAGQALIGALVNSAQTAGQAGDWATAVDHYRRAASVATTLRLKERADLQAAMEWANGQQRTAKLVKALTERLEVNSTDTATADQLVKLYVVELDTPQRAVIAANLGSDDKAKRLVPLAAKPMDELATAEHFELGEWYRSLARTASTQSKGTMLARAKDHYDRFLQQYEEEDLTQTRASLAKREVDLALGKLKASGQPDLTGLASRPSMRGGNRLFNGKDLTGWTFYRNDDDQYWSVQDGILVGKQTTDRKQRERWLKTKDESFSNFAMQFEFRMTPGTRAMVSFRSRGGYGPRIPLTNDPTVRSPLEQTGALYEVARSKPAVMRPSGEWNTMRIEMVGRRVGASINGKLTVDFTLPTEKNQIPKGAPNGKRLYFMMRYMQSAAAINFAISSGELQLRNIEVARLKTSP